jgi:hypothetical protein
MAYLQSEQVNNIILHFIHLAATCTHLLTATNKQTLNIFLHNLKFFCMLLRPRAGYGLLTLNDAPQSVGLIWTSDQLVAETST